MILTVICILIFLITGFVENVTASKVHSQLLKLHGGVDFELVKDAVTNNLPRHPP